MTTWGDPGLASPPSPYDDPTPCPECGAEDAEYGQHEPGCPSGYPKRDDEPAMRRVGRRSERRLNFLILTMPGREFVNLSLREGIDFLDEGWPEFGPFYILETE